MPTRTNKPATAWEIAKPILSKDYNEGTVTDSMKPKDVWGMRSEFKDVVYENFRSNFSRLKRTTKANQVRATIDNAGFLHDMTIYSLAKEIEGYWDGSEAQELLRQDIESNLHTQMKPQHLWLSRSEYQKFGLKKFRGHIHQELRQERETNYWIVKKKKKKQAAEAKRDGRTIIEDDMDLHDPVLNM